MIPAEWVREKLPQRLSHQNKGDFGHVLVLGGSVGMSGSVCMAAKSALRTGAGLVTVAVPEEICNIVSVKTTESMTLPLPSEQGVFSLEAIQSLRKFLPKVNTVVVGMGARVCPGILRILELLLTDFSGTLVIDADGLNTISEHPELLEIHRKCSVILTPHPGEMARLAGLTPKEVQENRLKIATGFAKDKQVTVVLKGEHTVITDGKQTFVNPTGNVGMATGGSGDVLAGMVGALAAQGLVPAESAACACYLHGLAGDIAAEEKTIYGLIAGDIIQNIPKAFKKIL